MQEFEDNTRSKVLLHSCQLARILNTWTKMRLSNLSQRTQIARFQSTATTNPVATTDFTYDSANRLSGIAHKQGSTNLNSYAYTYDPLSRISTIVSTLEGTDTYSYDQTSQLVGATHTSQSNETYGFNANGNQNTTGFTIATNNQTTAGLGFTYTFDDEGNRTSKAETATGKVEEYTWDYRNRLTKVVFRNSSGGAIVKQVEYEYDPYNRLVHRTFDADGAGSGAATNQFWVYDQGINAVLQFDGSWASNLSHRYLRSNNVDELLADEQIAGSNTLWGLTNHLGSLRDIADLNEGTGVTSITNHRTSNSFGKLISETNAAVDMLFAFTGKQYDEATALQHNLFRWYDPSMGQWLSEDPLGFGAGDENVRRYVGNEVLGSKDPTGLQDPKRFPHEEIGPNGWPARPPYSNWPPQVNPPENQGPPGTGFPSSGWDDTSGFATSGWDIDGPDENQNPGVGNPGVGNPGVGNPGVGNPGVGNPRNPPLGWPVDVPWRPHPGGGGHGLGPNNPPRRFLWPMNRPHPLAPRSFPPSYSPGPDMAWVPALDPLGRPYWMPERPFTTIGEQ
jgi:RHS repeat-associated protein